MLTSCILRSLNETIFQDKSGHALTTCPKILKYWTCIVVSNENTT